MGRSVIRLVANRAILGCRLEDYGDESSMLVLPGEQGVLLRHSTDEFVIRWDQAFVQDEESADGSLERLVDVVVYTAARPHEWPPFAVVGAIDRLRDGVELTAEANDDQPPDGDLFEQADGDPLTDADLDGIVADQYDEELDPARLLTAAATSMHRFAETIVILARQIARLAEEDSDAE